ncbi:hypothetical protein CB0940_11394 [Cercospora beticola]|uniref:Glycosyl transferase family 25 domain-containing protein n=1 Tax=Cercospora beticola TaxID=122368 RepID=A0A2G5HD93_CERBT|nr:hypothetical protein CB0940_11394 [Cercospora beticola]PIA90498.1 hypothetical protein CB0940_11394 [Cercospora beticola]WPB08241.1 hypothetical protein RHO25_012906 [Cercospora beticola]
MRSLSVAALRITPKLNNLDIMGESEKYGVQAYYSPALRSLNAFRSETVRFYGLCGLCISFLFFFCTMHGGPRIYGSLQSTISDITNTTLGFQMIFVLNIASRHDKRDAVSMSASVSNMDFEWLEGVDGALISNKAKPPKLEAGLERSSNTLGCWRAHMNAMQHIVKERIESALIMEDDVDWDVNIRKQLLEFANGARFVQGPGGARGDSNSPYGNDWDVLCLGHCGTGNFNDEKRWWVTPNDPTAVPPELYKWGNVPNLSPPALREGRFNRYIYSATGGRCLCAYAVSLRGARLFLNTETLALEQALPADRGMARLCHVRKFGAKCISPYPSIFGSHFAAGPMSKDSDRQTIAEIWRKVGLTPHVVFSTRLHLQRA